MVRSLGLAISIVETTSLGFLVFCGMAHSCSSPAPPCQFGGTSGCGRCGLRLVGGASGEGFVTAPALPTTAVTFFLAAARVRSVAAAAASAQ